MARTWKNVTQLEKRLTLGKLCHNSKMCHNWTNGSGLEKCVTIVKMGYTSKNVSQLEKYITFGKMCTLGKLSQLET